MNPFEVDHNNVISLVEGLRVLDVCVELFSLKYNKRQGDGEGKKRYRITEEIAYLYHTHSWNSSYQDYAIADKDTAIRGLLGLDDKWVMSAPLKILEQAVIDCQNANSLWRSLQFARVQLGRLETLISDTDNDPDLIIKYLEKLPKLTSTIGDLERQFNESKKSHLAIGGKEIGEWEL